MNNAEPEADTGEFIAVIGMAGRFPGAADIDDFWANLAAGTDSITREAPRVVPGGAADGGDLTYVPSRGRLEDAEWFDAAYFGYSAREAMLIDPQHRVFLECAVAALEDAGQDPDRFPGAVGVYGGSTETSYARALFARRERLAGVTEDDILLGTAPDFLVARTAERLGLRGPAVAVQSACATALVAVHTAGRALVAGDCDMALAGGVAVHVPPKKITWNGPDGTLAPDGVCRAFDARGEGTVAGNGVGVVVLRRLSDALADGDHIRAVIRGSAVTNDGSARVGFTAPSVAGQAAAVREAQLAADTDARTISYVEAHGTATPLGDPIEVAALTQAFRADTDERDFCLLGSVKTNIGHTDAAAGAAGLIKTVLALGHRKIPPSLHHTEPNPRIDFATSPFSVVTELRDWVPAGTTRRAGVSSFAVGGVNAHLVLEEAPERPSRESERRAHLLVHSGHTEQARDARLDRFASWLSGGDGGPEEPPSYADIAWTLQTGRREHRHRAFTVAVAGDAAPHDRVLSTEPPRERPVVFLFPGRIGPAEAWRLHVTEPAFREAFDTVLDLVGAGLARSVRELARGLARPGDPVVRDTYVLAFEYALAELWQRWGIRPATAFGSGVGGLTAAVVTGSLPLAGALRQIAESGTRADPAAALDALPDDPERVMLEVGAGAALTTEAARRSANASRRLLVASLPDVDDGADALAVLYRALGRLWLSGAAVDWAGVHDGERRRRTPLPTYPFERLPYLVRHPADDAWTHGGAPEIRTGDRKFPAADDRPGTGEAVGSAPAVAAGDKSGSHAPDRPADDTPLGLVLHLFGEALGLSDVEPDESFFELGGDSLVGVKVLARIREVYRVDIKMRSLFAAATATDLAELIEQQLGGRDGSTKEEAG
ncbi:JamP [Streptomyces sp. OF3]|uniref:JamP n=1 Tax=Streptomyces alkaliterrae TaxID=2213162 RepID=A0A7W3WH67_9ACTN|nr:beta-ketoacyl synthase N-terminal-like domain-containing protein [Streptomyces alkaliterrae]MBB1252302.1 JamP [Streptomyces alkaliterrae]